MCSGFAPDRVQLHRECRTFAAFRRTVLPRSQSPRIGPEPAARDLSSSSSPTLANRGQAIPGLVLAGSTTCGDIPTAATFSSYQLVRHGRSIRVVVRSLRLPMALMRSGRSLTRRVW